MFNIIIAFDSTQQALLAEMVLENEDVEIDTLPTPKEITAGCALSIAFQEVDIDEVKRILVDENVQIRGLFLQDNDTYRPLT
ncbi:DUF3343 domain-containing protein [Longirhabdus pacifica]|uniref:DUF3343 domain-containing protein n=1 Tax=Longirhabdus pacifica TaxID=2305227 RepID=UPI001008BFE1|nr:DUF3343 domain-containing protein [Longirhabdus pacifica]